MKGRLISTESRPVGEAVAAGEAELGIQQLSELMPVSGVEIAGPLPGNLQKFTVFAAAVLSRAHEKQAAAALLAHIAATSPPLLDRYGLMPPPLRGEGSPS
jgi:molybdate transport system substrate-binding protein